MGFAGAGCLQEEKEGEREEEKERETIKKE